MTPIVLWIRHGISYDGQHRPDAHARPGSPLTAEGIDQAAHAATALVREKRWPAVIASSPLRRARQTAAVVAETVDIKPMTPDAVFAEWRVPDCVLGRTPDEYPAAYQAWRQRRTHQPESVLPGGESLRAFAERARRATTAAQNLATTGGLVLVVSHRLLIGAVAALHDGYREPGEVFARACDFPLEPARRWSPTGDL